MTKKQRIQITVLILLLVTVLALQKLSPRVINHYQKTEVEKSRIETMEKVKDIDTKKPIESTLIESETSKTKINIPYLPASLKKGYLEVQFICQAPLQTVANWVFHEESCEEAAILQTMNYETGKTNTKEEAHEIILDMIKWQKDNFVEHKDLYAEDMKKFITEYYEIEEKKIEIVSKASIEDIKNAIRNGHPVIVPITGEILKNPYYKYPGYHMLVVTGFTEDKIITNDNGTMRGEDFSYDTDVFKNAFNDASGDIIIINL